MGEKDRGVNHQVYSRHTLLINLDGTPARKRAYGKDNIGQPPLVLRWTGFDKIAGEVYSDGAEAKTKTE